MEHEQAYYKLITNVNILVYINGPINIHKRTNFIDRILAIL